MSDDIEQRLISGDLDQLSQLKLQYELSENNLKCLKKLAYSAIRDYESLQLKYDQNQKQYEELRSKHIEAEDNLARLQNVLEPACNEFNNLNVKLQVERACRSEAERFASKTHHENNKLKRQSQMLLDKLSTAKTADISTALETITDEDINDNVSDNNNVQRCNALNDKIGALEQEVRQLESKLIQSEAQRAASVQKEADAIKKCKRLEVEMLSVCRRLEDHDQAMQTFTKASELAFGEFADLKYKYQSQLELTKAAEVFAHTIYKDNEALKRQSTVLMSQDILGDARLMQALMTIEDLTKQLETVKQENKDKIETLEKSLSADDNTKRLNDMEIELQLTSNEVARLQRALTEMEDWKEKLINENEDLSSKLDNALHPPPPPPPPPPPCPLLHCITSTKLVIKKKTDDETPTITGPASGGSRVQPRTQGAGNDSKGALMGEMAQMMDRIKGGSHVLNKASDRRPSITNQAPKESHMNELQKLLGNRKNRSTEAESNVKLVRPSDLRKVQVQTPPSSSTPEPVAPRPDCRVSTSSVSTPRLSSSSQSGTPPPVLPKPSKRGSNTAISPAVNGRVTLPSVSEDEHKNGSPTNGVSSRASKAAAVSTHVDTSTNL